MEIFQIILQPLLVGVAIIVALANYLARKDAIKKLSGITISKTYKWLRSGIMGLISLTFSILMLEYMWSALDFWNCFWLFTFLHSIYWTTFDISFNRFSNESYDYISDNQQDHNDVITDWIFHWLPDKYSGKVQFVFKLMLMLISAYNVIQIFISNE